jgi:hypothetical protein
VGALVMTGMLLSAILPAYAGGGAGGGGTTFLAFLCYNLAGGARQEREITLSDQFGEQTVTLGTARLLCTQATGAVLTGELDPEPFGADHLKCYSKSSSVRPGEDVELTDIFDVETVGVRRSELVCVLAVKVRNGNGETPPVE